MLKDKETLVLPEDRDDKKLPSELPVKLLSDLIADEDGVMSLHIQSYDSVKAYLSEMLDSMPVFIVQDDKDKKYAKALRALLNKLSKALNDKKLSAIRALTSEFETEVKDLVKLVDDKSKEFDKAVKNYEEAAKAAESSDGVVKGSVKSTTYTVTVKTTNPEVVNKIKQIALDNNCEVSVK